jgi:hypothetical protein
MKHCKTLKIMVQHRNGFLLNVRVQSVAISKKGAIPAIKVQLKEHQLGLPLTRDNIKDYLIRIFSKVFV